MTSISSVGFALAIAGGQLENALLEKRRMADRLLAAKKAYDSACNNVDHWENQVNNIRASAAVTPSTYSKG